MSGSYGMKDFSEVIRGVYAQDERSIHALVDHFEPHIRRVVRVRMLNPRLRQLVDSRDVTQSILAKFLVSVREGKYELESPEAVRGLLFRMARNKVCDWVRRQASARRNMAREQPLSSVDSHQLRCRDEIGPLERLERLEEMQHFRNELTESARRIADYRAAGLEWDDIAKMDGAQRSADATRMRFFRQANRIARRLKASGE